MKDPNTGKFTKGNPGRPKGSQNKSTATAKEAFQTILDGHVERLSEWIERVAEDDPHKAFTMVMEVAKYCVPKYRADAPPPPPWWAAAVHEVTFAPPSE